MMRKSLLIVLFAIVILSITLVVPAIGEESKWEVDSISLLRDDGSGKAGDPVKFFTPEDRTQHVLVRFKSMKVGKFKPKFVFTAVSAAGLRNEKFMEWVGEDNLIVNWATVHLELPRDFPLGEYKVELFMNDELVATQNYYVQTKLDKLEIRECTLHLANADGGVGDQVETFKPANRDVYLVVHTSGIEPGTKFNLALNAVKTSAGHDVKLNEWEIDITELGSFTVTLGTTLSEDWATGEYRLDLHLNGKFMKSFPLEVKP